MTLFLIKSASKTEAVYPTSAPGHYSQFLVVRVAHLPMFLCTCYFFGYFMFFSVCVYFLCLIVIKNYLFITVRILVSLIFLTKTSPFNSHLHTLAHTNQLKRRVILTRSSIILIQNNNSCKITRKSSIL